MAEENQNQAIRVAAETRKTLPFIILQNANIVGKDWKEFLEGIEREFRYFKNSDQINKNLII